MNAISILSVLLASSFVSACFAQENYPNLVDRIRKLEDRYFAKVEFQHLVQEFVWEKFESSSSAVKRSDLLRLLLLLKDCVDVANSTHQFETKRCTLVHFFATMDSIFPCFESGNDLHHLVDFILLDRNLVKKIEASRGYQLPPPTTAFGDDEYFSNIKRRFAWKLEWGHLFFEYEACGTGVIHFVGKEKKWNFEIRQTGIRFGEYIPNFVLLSKYKNERAVLITLRDETLFFIETMRKGVGKCYSFEIDLNGG